MPISGGVMCQSGTRIGSTNAIDSALKASKKVALPITTRAITNQRDAGTCSMRAINRAEACSVSKSDGDEDALEPSDGEVALTTDKASSALPAFESRFERPVVCRSISYREHVRPSPEFFRQSLQDIRSASNGEPLAAPITLRAALPFGSVPTSLPAWR